MSTILKRSSAIRAVGSIDEDLLVKFSNNYLYLFSGASEHYADFVSASSPGKYYNNHIRKKYEPKRIK